MILSPLLLLLVSPAACPPTPATPQAQAEEKSAKEKKKRAFPKLPGVERKRAENWLHDLRASKLEETAAEARDALIALGAGVVPMTLDYWRKMDEKRLPYLVAVLDKALIDADLDLAWKEVGKKTEPAARVYLVRRLADSRREDAETLLKKRLEGADAGSREAYESARGLAWRRNDEGLKELLTAVATDWGENRERLRQDFVRIERGPLSVQVTEFLHLAKSRDDKLAALRLFELLGAETQLLALKPSLRDPDNVVKLAAINACRAVNGEKPADNASVMQIIQMSQEWEAKL